MARLRTPLCFALTLAGILALPVQAETQPQWPATSSVTGLRSSWVPGTSRSYLGLNLDRSSPQLPCNSIALLCDGNEPAARLYAGTMVGNFWGVEMAYLDSPRRAARSIAGAQGLNLSLVGKAPLGRAFGVYGKLGTTLGRPATSVMGASGAPAAGIERGFGLSYGAGVSVAFTPRLSATLQWESNDFRFAGSVGDQVRSTSLGLQYRY